MTNSSSKSKEFFIDDIKYDLNDYYLSCNINKEVQERLSVNDIVIVPDKYKDTEYYFAQESINFIKYCTQNNQAIKIDILGEDIKVRSLHSFDIWMPVIWVSSNVVLPIIIGLVTNYIYDKMKGREKEDAQVDVTFIVNRDGEEKCIHYHGDAKTFRKTFEKIDFNNL